MQKRVLSLFMALTLCLTLVLPVPALAADNYVITFDVLSPTGSADDVAGLTSATANTSTEGTLASLPTLTLDGYRFRGWFTGSAYSDSYNGYDDGDAVTTDYVFSYDTYVYAHWTRLVTITWDANKPETASGSVTGLESQTSVLEYQQPLGALPELALEGYTFQGWSTQADDYWDDNYVDNRVSDTDYYYDDTTVYAQWSQNPPYTITLDGNKPEGITADVEGLTTTSVTTDSNGYVMSLPEPVLADCVFIDWRDSDGNYYDKNSQFTKDLTLYANWSRIYTVTLNPNKPEEARGDVTVSKYDSNYVTDNGNGTYAMKTEGSGTLYCYYVTNWNYNDNTFLPGYRFLGWYDAPTGGNQIAGPNEYSVTIDSDMTLYAHWSATSYAIVYDVNSPTGKSDDVVGLTTRSGNTVTGGNLESLPTLTLDGYRFRGWFTSSGYGDQYQGYDDGDAITTDYLFSQDQTIYAHWSRLYTVTFDANTPSNAKSAVTGLDETETAREYDETMGTLPVPALEGFEFKGWSTMQDDWIQNGYLLYECTADIVYNSDYTVYAQWQQVAPFEITYDVNKPEGAEAEVQGLTQASDSTDTNGYLVSLPTLTLSGYNFNGWLNPDNGYYVDNSTQFNRDTTLLAQWAEDHTHSITFDFALPEGARTEPTAQYIANLTDNTDVTDSFGRLTTYSLWCYSEITLPGYRFISWNTQPNGGGVEVDLGQNFTADTTLYANWSATSYAIVLELKSPTGDDADVSGIATGSLTTTTGGVLSQLPEPTVPGYRFDGWYLYNNNIEEYRVVANETLFADNTTIFAFWTPIYVVKFNANTPSNAKAEVASLDETERDVVRGDALGELPEPTLDGFEFQGWSLYAGDWDDERLDDPVRPDFSSYEDVEIYAQWKQVAPFEVTFNVNKPSGVEAEVSGLTKAFDTTDTNGYLIALPTLTMAGYICDGWFTEASGGNTVTNSMQFTRDTVVYAQWREDLTHSVTFNFNVPDGAKVQPSSRIQSELTDLTDTTDDYGHLTRIPAWYADATLPGYLFVSWKLSDGTDVNLGGFVFTEDTTLYANWSETSYTIVFNVESPTGNNEDVTGLASRSLNTVTGGVLAELPEVALQEYTFGGWYYRGEPVLANETVFYGDDSVTARWLPSYTVTWLVNTPDSARSEATGLQASSVTIQDGGVVGELPALALEGYDFLGWSTQINDPELEHQVLATDTSDVDMKLYAQWRAKKYTVTFNREDGTEISSQAYDYGTAASAIVKPENPTKEATAQHTYTFAGWTPEIADVTADATYTAAFTETVRQYTVKFVNEDGTELSSASYDYGTAANAVEKPENPTKEATAQYTYMFVGWTPEIANVTADAMYTAVYTENDRQYTVILLNEDGSELDRAVWQAGQEESVTSKVPAKPSDEFYVYTFSSWQTTGMEGQTRTYSPIFASIMKTENVIIWLNGDGSELDRVAYTAGQTEPVTSAIPVKAENALYTYTFTGWDSGRMEGNIKIYSPVFASNEKTQETHTVSYDANGGSGEMEGMVVPAGSTISLPDSRFTPPSNQIFSAWRINGTEYQPGDYVTVSNNLTVSAQWTQKPPVQGCYVATAVYGSYDCPEVWTLRRYRDKILAKTWYGRLFIHLYYMISPTAVRLFGQSQWFQSFFRNRLDPWVANLQANGFESTPYNDLTW